MKLPRPEDYPDVDYILAVGKAYGDTYVLLIEAATLLDILKPYVDNDYGKELITNYLNKLNHE